MDLSLINSELIAAKPYFSAIATGWSEPILGPLGDSVDFVMKYRRWVKKGHRILGGPQEVVDLAAQWTSDKLTERITAPIGKFVLAANHHVSNDAIHRKYGPDGARRTWISKPGKYEMVIVFHDAYRAGPHIDVHMGKLSLVYRVKPDVYSQLKYNRNGMLTEASRELLLDHVKSEILSGSRVPQNLDHKPAEAIQSWTNGDPDDRSYGAGATRQIISQSQIDVYKIPEDLTEGAIEFYAPALDGTHAMYLYRLYPGDEKKAPICIWGVKMRQPSVQLEDRLHLKMILPQNFDDKAKAKYDMRSSTVKYDGASTYIIFSPKGTTVWSPRMSKKDSKRIEYTFKLNGIANIKTEETVVVMGEILFKKKGSRKYDYLPAATTGGILNSHLCVPDDTTFEVRLYRVDRIGRTRTTDLPFWENRQLQEEVAKLDPKHLKVAELMKPGKAFAAGFEGVVIAPADKSVGQAAKVKWWDDPNDWRIDQINFDYGEKGGIAGTITCTSLDSDKQFKLGPGQVGNHELCQAMMASPDDYIGSVIKVNSRQGHEGRAAKLVAFHMDKGFAPIEPTSV